MQMTKVPGKEASIYDRWVKPQLGLNDNIGACWSGRPVGNSQELMPLDNSLNKDIHESFQRHTSLSLIIHKTDVSYAHLFSMVTPKLTSHAERKPTVIICCMTVRVVVPSIVATPMINAHKEWGTDFLSSFQ